MSFIFFKPPSLHHWNAERRQKEADAGNNGVDEGVSNPGTPKKEHHHGISQHENQTLSSFAGFPGLICFHFFVTCFELIDFGLEFFESLHMNEVSSGLIGGSVFGSKALEASAELNSKT